MRLIKRDSVLMAIAHSSALQVIEVYVLHACMLVKWFLARLSMAAWGAKGTQKFNYLCTYVCDGGSRAQICVLFSGCQLSSCL